MATALTPSEYHERHAADLPHWRFMISTIEATFRARTFDAGARFVSTVAAAAEEAAHHPDMHLRYPGRVHVVLTTHGEQGRVTDLDVEMAATISTIASDLGLRSEPTDGQVVELALDATDVAAVRPFWLAVLDYQPHPAEADGDTAIVDPRRSGPTLWFQDMDPARTERGRFHLDVTVPAELAEARVAAAIGAGGTLVTDEFAPAWWVLADAEGNEACVCTWQDRD